MTKFIIGIDCASRVKVVENKIGVLICFLKLIDVYWLIPLLDYYRKWSILLLNYSKTNFKL